MEKYRYYVDTHGVDDLAVKQALSQAIEFRKSDSSIKQIVFLIHTKDNTGYLERVFGVEKLKALFGGTIQSYENGPFFKIETLKTIKDNSYNRTINYKSYQQLFKRF